MSRRTQPDNQDDRLQELKIENLRWQIRRHKVQTMLGLIALATAIGVFQLL